MGREDGVEIKYVNGKNTEYIIKDNYGINLGRIYIVGFSKENKYCCFRIKFYKKDKAHVIQLRKTLNIMIKSLFKNNDIHKISVIAEEDIMTSVFVDLGFMLEGVLQESIISNNLYKSELIFGIDSDTFKNANNINVFRLEGTHVELKILTPEDSQDVYDYYVRNKKHLEPFEPARDSEFYTLEGQRILLMEGYKQFLNGTSINFGIYINKKFIGKIQLSNIVMGIFHNAFVGYSIDRDYQGKGYMKEALSILLDYAFEDMELHRIEASTLVDNVRSQRVLESCGFKEVGVSEKYLFINGKWRDHKIFYITKE
ncbi:GNAT family N-acetyltransferase [Clostridium botulinum]|nr:GNAT family N-acetyltransferase [Clostridium botulinum]NFV20621.1 GNAT family N-acetyltransferase [Clostridium botulinum]